MADMPKKRSTQQRRTPHNTNQKSKKPPQKKENYSLDTKVFALGGLNEVGKNMYCIEHNDEIPIKIIKIKIYTNKWGST